ncbi:NAD(P)-binding protein [Daedalea quercina L-15889]|uniref:NAD(P)-binding protein n=1 Tax=Daedalea quercina L-15889 TaxID=1314783 RepID=A0A165NRF8_9APHY|nr:NAD(P)-binding protein [Daedalea quercina L-15889]
MAAAVPLRRIALVTGAAQGIGRCIALRLAKDGLNVAVNDISSKRQQLDEVVSEIGTKEGRQAVAVTGDVSLEDDAREMTESVVERLGGLDVLVANAAILRSSELVDSSVDEWDKIMSINLRGTMLSYKYAALQMIQQGRGGRIIGASSVAGKRGAAAYSAYVASKFGVRGLTQSAALELAKHKITVNAYAPGVIATSMVAFPEDLERGVAPGTTMLERADPHARFGPPPGPEVIASLVSYLAQPEAYFITGQTINVDGGMHFD